jgi:hypothetical protein
LPVPDPGQALELRKAGASYTVIAKQLQFESEDAAREAVTSALADALADEGRERQLLERLRIDSMLMGLWPKARAGDIRAVQETVGLMERKRLLEETG